jgi:hypothetical protein
MEHPDDEVLTQFALDDPLALDAATLVHISDCDQCTSEIQQIQRVVDAALAAGGRPDQRVLETPPSDVWERVLVEVGSGAGPAVPSQQAAARARPTLVESPAVLPVLPTPSALPEPQPPTDPSPDDAGDRDAPVWLFDQPAELETAGARAIGPADRPTDRRTLWQVAVAAAVGLVLGAGAAWVVADRSSTPDTSTAAETVTRSALSGIDGHSTSGEISLTTGADRAPQITVSIDNLDKGPGFLEAWLLNADTGGMVALGVLDGDKGTFNVPPSLNLSHYSQVDISREPFDGEPAHSSVSLARGPVPEA